MTEGDVNFRLQPLKKRERSKPERERDREREPEDAACWLRLASCGADWEPARSRETMTTRQPTLATNAAFSQSEPDGQLSKG